MQALLKILAWMIWCSIFGALLGTAILHNYASMGHQDYDIPLMTRTVVIRGIILGSGMGFVLGLAACVPKRRREPKGLIAENSTATEPMVPPPTAQAAEPGLSAAPDSH
jgi:hypothetical protein